MKVHLWKDAHTHAVAAATATGTEQVDEEDDAASRISTDLDSFFRSFHSFLKIITSHHSNAPSPNLLLHTHSVFPTDAFRSFIIPRCSHHTPPPPGSSIPPPPAPSYHRSVTCALPPQPHAARERQRRRGMADSCRSKSRSQSGSICSSLNPPLLPAVTERVGGRVHLLKGPAMHTGVGPPPAQRRGRGGS